MDQIKYVIDELNQPPFNQNLNLITYDNLREEQRLDLLIQILNIIDPKLNLPMIRVGNIEDTVTTILDTLRIFKYSPPASHSNPIEFRKNLILGDKDLLTNIFEWLLKRLPLLKKRAYLARFLVKIELSPDVEGDQDVMILYRQYLNLIDEFKKIHSSYEMQKKSIDSIIELQKDIKTMELEKDQIKNKLDIVKRRVNMDLMENNGASSSSQQQKFEMVRSFVMARHEGEKLNRQLREQLDKIEMVRKQIEHQQNDLAEMNLNDWKESIQSPEVMLYKFKDEIDIKQKLAKDVLPNELTDLRLLVRDLENIQGQTDSDVKDQLSRTVSQVQALTHEINDLVEKKLLNKQNEEDRLSHYRQNAQAVANKKEEAIHKCQELEKTLSDCETELDELRSQFSLDGETTLRGDALKLYIEKISRRETEMNEMKEELNRTSSDIDELRSKLRSLKQQEKETMEEIHANEETIGLEGFFQMKESTLNAVVDDNDDGLEDNGQETFDYEQMNQQIDSLQDRLDHIKTTVISTNKEVRILKEELREVESEYEMKKRLYDSAAAGLEAELSRCEAEMDRLSTDRDQLDGQCFETRARLLALQTEQLQLFGPSTAAMVIEQLKLEIVNETKLQDQLKQQETEWKQKEEYYRRQMEMWRDLRVIFEVKQRLLAQKQQDRNREKTMGIHKDHLVLEQ